MKIRSLFLALVVAGGLAAMHVANVDSAEARTIYTGTANGGVWKTTDGSNSSGNTIYVGSANGGVWKTTNGGPNW